MAIHKTTDPLVLIAGRLAAPLARRRTASVRDPRCLFLALPLLAQPLVLLITLDARPVVFGHVAPLLYIRLWLAGRVGSHLLPRPLADLILRSTSRHLLPSARHC